MKERVKKDLSVKNMLHGDAFMVTFISNFSFTVCVVHELTDVLELRLVPDCKSRLPCLCFFVVWLCVVVQYLVSFSSFAFTSQGKERLFLTVIVFLSCDCWCFLWLFLTEVPCVGLQGVIVVFPIHTHFHFRLCLIVCLI